MATWNSKNWNSKKTDTVGPWVFLFITPTKVVTLDMEGHSRPLDMTEALAQAEEGALVLDASKVSREIATQIAQYAPQPDPRVPPGQIKRLFDSLDEIPPEILAKLPPGVTKDNSMIASNLDKVHPETWAGFWIDVTGDARTGRVHAGMIVWDDASLRPTQSRALA